MVLTTIAIKAIAANFRAIMNKDLQVTAMTGVKTDRVQVLIKAIGTEIEADMNVDFKTVWAVNRQTAITIMGLTARGVVVASFSSDRAAITFRSTTAGIRKDFTKIKATKIRINECTKESRICQRRKEKLLMVRTDRRMRMNLKARSGAALALRK